MSCLFLVAVFSETTKPRAQASLDVLVCVSLKNHHYYYYVIIIIIIVPHALVGFDSPIGYCIFPSVAMNIIIVVVIIIISSSGGGGGGIVVAVAAVAVAVVAVVAVISSL